MIPWAPLLLSDDALEILSGRKWPGNVRELLHVIERAVVLASDDSLGADDFPEDDVSKTPGPPGSLQEHVNQTSREHVLSVLDRTNWRKKEAAEILGVDRATLYRMLKKYSIERDRT
jgi:transcriptional regulator of acetoin/glycerol metabolism